MINPVRYFLSHRFLIYSVTLLHRGCSGLAGTAQPTRKGRNGFPRGLEDSIDLEAENAEGGELLVRVAVEHRDGTVAALIVEVCANNRNRPLL